MARSFKELGRESSELIEQGKELESQVQQCRVQIQSASAAVSSARQDFERASDVDEEGNPVGDVSEARARLAVAQNQLAACQRALQRAQQAVETNKQQKQQQIQKIEQHNRISRSNITRVGELGGFAFSENIEEVQQGLIERYNEIEQARIALLESMGEKASPESIQAPPIGRGNSDWSGAGFGALDLQGEEQSFQGGSGKRTQGSANMSQAQPNGNMNSANGGNVFSDDNSADGKPDGAGYDTGFSNNQGIAGRGSSGSGNSRMFSGFEVDKHINGSDYFVKGANYERFKKDYYSSEDYTYRIFDEPKTVSISPSLIEGIHLSEYDVDNPSNFWSQHKRDGSQESFREIAKHIPEVRKQLDSGRTKEDLLQDPVLGTCTQIYFVDKTRVVECDGYYEFDSNGRHRILAARELGYEIPVEVIGRKEYPQTANILLAKMPKESDFNPVPKQSVNNSISYNLRKYGKDSHQHQSFLSRSLDPVRNRISRNKEISEYYGKRVDELYDLVKNDFRFSSGENRERAISEMRNYQSAVKVLQDDIRVQQNSLNEQAAKLGLSNEHINTRFVGFRGNTDIHHACDNVITSRQTGGTCGVNSSVSCENQILGTHKTQYEGFLEFIENKWCVTDPKNENRNGGTNYITRQNYFNHIGLDCESKLLSKGSLNEMCSRLSNGESILMTVHAQDLKSSGLIDTANLEPYIEKRGNREVLVVKNVANHAVNVVGFEVGESGEIASVYINDTGGFNDFRDESGNVNRVNLISLSAEKFTEMVKNTVGMCVQFVKKGMTIKKK